MTLIEPIRARHERVADDLVDKCKDRIDGHRWVILRHMIKRALNAEYHRGWRDAETTLK